MAKLNHSSTLSIGGRVAASWSASVGAVAGGTDKLKKEISSLKDRQRSVTQELTATTAAAARLGVAGSADVAKLTKEHKKLSGEQAVVAAQLKKAQREASKLGEKGAAEVDRLLDVSEQLEHQERALTRRLTEARKAAEKLGIEGSKEAAKLRKEHEALNSTLDRERLKLKNVKAWHELDVGGRTTSALKRIGSGFLTVGKYALYAAAGIGAAAAGGIGWFTKSAIDAASAMETLETSLVTTTGSSAKAKEAVGWIKEFGKTTPYEVGQVGEAFARLKAYGIDPTDGTLRTLGDTASSMGKDLMSGVEALADAVTGENERLKEFGVRASKAGGYITYFYKNAAGEDVKKRVKANSQEVIRSTLMAIFNEKYAGAMDKQSRTWKGLMSNLSDQWTDFQIRVMEGGVFDLIKGKAEELLEQVNKWASDGTLERWAGQIGEAYKWAFDRLSEGFSWVQAHWPEIKQAFQDGATAAKDTAVWIYKVGKWASDAVGGPENLAKVLAALGAAKVMAPLGSLVGVGLDIVGWLSKAVGLTGALQKGLGAAGGAVGGLAKGAAGGAAGWLSGLGTSVAAAGSGAIAGTVAVGGALGYGLGTAADYGYEALTGKKASTGIGEWLSSDIDARRAASLDDGRGPSSTKNMRSTRGAAAPTVINNSDNKVINIKVDAKGADAKEVAKEVGKELSQSMRREALASYG